MGVKSRKRLPRKVGDFGAFDRDYIVRIGGRLVAKSMDDRSGVVV